MSERATSMSAAVSVTVKAVFTHYVTYKHDLRATKMKGFNTHSGSGEVAECLVAEAVRVHMKRSSHEREPTTALTQVPWHLGS